MKFTPHQLHIFEAVARRLSFTRAAEELSLAQPTVSAQMKQLGRRKSECLCSIRRAGHLADRCRQGTVCHDAGHIRDLAAVRDEGCRTCAGSSAAAETGGRNDGEVSDP